MGDRIININNAIKLIDSSSKNSILLKSEIYKSKAMYNTKLEDFYNVVIKIKTELSPLGLLDFFKNIEQKMGRINSIHRYSNRPIDIDILSYGDKVIDSKDKINKLIEKASIKLENSIDIFEFGKSLINHLIVSLSLL